MDYVGEPEADGYRQINGKVKDNQTLGEQEFVVEFAGVSSAPILVQVTG